MENKIVLLVVENRDTVLMEYFKYVLQLQSKLYGIIFWEGKRKPIWFMRRELIKRALSKDCTHVLFLDTDVIPQSNFLERLLFIDADMVSGVYYHGDGTPVSRKDGKPYNGTKLEKVDTCSMGASLIKREVLEKVEYPEPDNVTIDADIEFCRQIREAGFSILQDFENKCYHLQLIPVIK